MEEGAHELDTPNSLVMESMAGWIKSLPMYTENSNNTKANGNKMVRRFKLDFVTDMKCFIDEGKR